jgi:hypothetical protein
MPTARTIELHPIESNHVFNPATISSMRSSTVLSRDRAVP